MRVLLVSPYPPARDGLASYAVQLGAGLRAQGHRVTVVSPEPSAANYRADPRTLIGTVRIIWLSRRADRTLVQFHPTLFFVSGTRAGFLAGIWRMLILFRLGRDVRVYVHETDNQRGRRGARRGRAWAAVWQRANRILVHTERERADMVRDYGVNPARVGVIPHGANFVRRTSEDRTTARRTLGIAEHEFVFLCIGFIQPHKGFDRALRAFTEFGSSGGVRLDIVGSVRVPSTEYRKYSLLLHHLADGRPNVRFHENYVNDVVFDRWIVASDVVVLPYREIWSSGVVERAAMYQRPAIVTDVGGLAEQAPRYTHVVHDHCELTAAMAQAAGLHVPPTSMREGPEEPSRGLAMRRVRERAASLRRWYGIDPYALDNDSEQPGSRIGALDLPTPPSSLSPRGLALRVIHRLTRWEIRPIVDYVNTLRDVILERQSAAEEGRTARRSVKQRGVESE